MMRQPPFHMAQVVDILSASQVTQLRRAFQGCMLFGQYSHGRFPDCTSVPIVNSDHMAGAFTTVPM